MNGVRQVCHCGHDIDTHHERMGACLGIGCNARDAKPTDCDAFRDDTLPDTKLAKLRKPNHQSKWRGEYVRCECYDCRAWRKANGYT